MFDNDRSNLLKYSHLCTCDQSDSDCSSYEDDYYEDSLSEETYDEGPPSKKKRLFISTYNNSTHGSLIIVSTSEEIKNYHEKYSLLSQKSTKNVDNNVVWGDVKVYHPLLGYVPLKSFIDIGNKNKKTKKKKKECKKPIKGIEKKIHSDTSLTDSEQSDNVTGQKLIQSNEKKIDLKDLGKSMNSIQLQNKNLKPKTEIIKKPENFTETNNKNKTKQDNLKNNTNKSNLSNTTIKLDKIIDKTTDLSNKTLQASITNKTVKNNTNNKNIKSDISEPIFKKPCIEKMVKPSSNKISKTNINDTNTLELDVDDSSSKKKRKKQRQKEKKLENMKRDASNSSSKKVSESNNKKASNIKTINPKSNQNCIKKKSDQGKSKSNSVVEMEESNDDTEEKTEGTSSDDDDIDLLTDNQNMSSFFAGLIKRKQNQKKKPESKQSSKPVLTKKDEEEGFIIHSRKSRDKTTTIQDKNHNFLSNKFGEEAIDMMLKKDLKGGLDHITEAIGYNSSDHRHYLNRSYCYLRMNKPTLALTDAQYVIQTTTNIGHVFIANLRAGQASLALQKYQQAEMYLKEAVHINPENHHAQRELLCVKIKCIVNMGFQEKDVILALEKYPSTLEAIDYLTKRDNFSKNTHLKNDLEISYNSYDDVIYSSDEDERPNNVEIVNRMLNYKPSKMKLLHVVAKPLSLSDKKHVILENGTEVKKKTSSISKIDKAIWVGNLTNSITDKMLKQKFKQFGNVFSIYRPYNESYAFINYEKSEDVINALTNTSCHEIAGIKLTVRSAVRQI